MECYGEGRRLRGKVAAAEAEQPRNHVLQSRNPRNTNMGMTCGKRARPELEGLKQHERETQEAIVDISGQKKTILIKSENQEQEDEMSAVKMGVPRSENLRHEWEGRFKTELPEVETAGTGTPNTVVSPETLKKMGAYDEVNDDILSTLSGPPQVPDASGLTAELGQAYALAIPAVKNALISFLITKKSEDLAFMISQANSAFASLYALNADCGSLYNNVRSYIRHYSEFSTAQKELQENMEAVELVSSYENISDQSTEAARAVSEIEANLEKAREYLAPLEARYQETKALLDKLEAELGQRRTEVAYLEAEKIQQEEAMAETEIKHHTIAAQAKEAKETLQSILRRLEAATAAMEETKALLSTS
ncbi:PREDICTED: uncharacterized protein LOC105139127 [Populus euphratica]|uniref:Uncharacterized protein LOC105139127 n=1 Tax=Populus euphratica TaxID=75702 RepID=A0AAJ6Y5Z5_POPEU|nr:PREDICTED: uncharacterized protein LOC105139127 [Populus euphratica]